MHDLPACNIVPQPNTLLRNLLNDAVCNCIASNVILVMTNLGRFLRKEIMTLCKVLSCHLPGETMETKGIAQASRFC
jgi:hypothetical protein